MMFKEMRRIDKKMSQEMVIALLTRGQVGVLSTISENGYPYGIAVNYVYYQDKIYFHCAKTGQKIDNIKKNPKIAFTVYDSVEVIGDELNTKYQSVVVFGKAKMIEPTEEILLELVKKYSNLPKEKVQSMINKEINITALVEIEIEHLTGKIGS